MITVASGRVTVSDARDLDRAMILLQKGRITYSRWVETLDAWARGADISTFDYGAAESTAERILRTFRGERYVTAQDVAARINVEEATASQILSRLCRRRQARRIEQGVYSLAAQAPSATKERP